MLAMVRDCLTGEPATIHRTFLTAAGAKADMDNPRAMMPGVLPESVSVRLAEAGEVLGIAEGIETALAAQAKFGVPCHAALTAGFLAKWQPPEGVRKVIVFGDCDQSFTGQAAAYTLANKASLLIGKDGYQLKTVVVSLLLRFQADFECLTDHGVKTDYLDFINQHHPR
jgi:putative DNA primase/helicase